MDVTTALTLTLAAALLAGAYLLTCRIWPYGACRRCRGTGKLRSPFAGDTWRKCPRCKATGARLRLGRRAWSGWQTLRKDIHR